MSTRLNKEFYKIKKLMLMSCLVIVGWATASINLEHTSITIGILSFSIPMDSIQLIFFLYVSYLMYKLFIIFKNHPRKVKQRKTERKQFINLTYIYRFILLVLVASFISRSWEMLFVLLIYTISLIIVFFIIAFLSQLMIMIILLQFTNRNSIASTAIESYFYSLFITGILYIIGNIFLIADLLTFQSNIIDFFINNFTEVNALLITVMILMISVFTQRACMRKLFIITPGYKELSDGRIIVKQTRDEDY